MTSKKKTSGQKMGYDSTYSGIPS